MRQGYEIAKILKNVESDTFKEREHRALLLANALAFRINLGHDSIDEVVDREVPKLRKLANEINNHQALDVTLLEKLFTKVLQLRYELMNGVTNPDLIQMAFNSDAAEMFLDGQELTVGKALVNKTSFYNQQTNLTEALNVTE